MIYLLLILSAGTIVALFLIYKNLQQEKAAHERTQKRVKESEKRLKDADRKYGGLISKEEVLQQLTRQINETQIKLNSTREQKALEEKDLSSKIEDLEVKLSCLEEIDFFGEFGFYQSKYDFQDSDDFKFRLDQIRDHQKQFIRQEKAVVCHIEWTVHGSAKEGKRMTNNFIKLVLRAFNGECDAAISKVKYNNIGTLENRVRKTYDALNKLSTTTQCEITEDFLDLKLQELWLTHEYKEKKHQEQEEQRLIREQMREEEKALRELEKARRESEQEEKRYQESLEKARKEVESATGRKQEKLLEKIEELEKRLEEAEANKERAISQAQLTKSGHVYIISNIGSFGQDVYKIGMTRRLEPMDRVKELGDASVPFSFDVHAMIFCDNAPELETQLHKRFHHRRINKINERKEFFKISIDEIVDAVREIDEELQTCRSEILFTKVAEASEYRKTLAQERADHSNREIFQT